MEKIIFITAESNPLLFAYCIQIANQFCYDNNNEGEKLDDIYSHHENIHLCGNVYGHFITGFTDDFKPIIGILIKFFANFKTLIESFFYLKNKLILDFYIYYDNFHSEILLKISGGNNYF